MPAAGLGSRRSGPDARGPEPAGAAFPRDCDTVAVDFSGTTALELLRLREHRLFRSGFRLDEFADILAELFSR